MAKKLGKIRIGGGDGEYRELDLDALVEKCAKAILHVECVSPCPTSSTGPKDCRVCEARAVLRVVAREARHD